MDSRLASGALHRGRARSFDNLGWYLGTSGVGLLYLPDGAALPERLSFGLPSLVYGAVSSWPDGVWVGTDRTSLTDATLTFVDSELREFRTVQGPPASGTPFTRILDLGGQGRRVWAATDRGVARVNPTEGRIELRGRDPRAARRAGLRSVLSPGPDHGRDRPRRRARGRVAGGRADRAPIRGPGVRGLPRRRLGLGRHLARRAGRRSRISPTCCGRRASASAGSQQPVLGLGRPGRHARGAGPRPAALAQPRRRSGTSGPPLSSVLGRLVAFVADRSGLVGGRRPRRRLRPAQRARPAGAPRGRPAGAANDLAVDETYLWVATDAGLVRFRLDAIRP